MRVAFEEKRESVDRPRTDPTGSLDRDLATHFFDGLLEGLGIVLGDAFFDHLGSSFDQSFGIAQAQAGRFANGLENFDLGGSFEAFQDNIELGLFFSSVTATSGARQSRADSITSSSGCENLPCSPCTCMWSTPASPNKTQSLTKCPLRVMQISSRKQVIQGYQ